MYLKFFSFLLLLLCNFTTQAQQIKKVPFYVGRMIYVSSMEQLLVYGRMGDQTFGDDKFHFIDPKSGAISSTKDVGFRPFDIQLSADQKLLYLLTSDLDSTVVALNFPDLSVNYAYAVRSVGGDKISAHDLAVSPTDPYQTVVYSDKGLEVFDRGRPLPNIFPKTKSRLAIAYSGDGQFIFAQDNVTTGNSLFQFRHNQAGIVEPENEYFFFTDDTDPIIDGNRLYSLEGSVLDISSGRPVLIGSNGVRTNQITQRTFLNLEAIFTNPGSTFYIQLMYHEGYLTAFEIDKQSLALIKKTKIFKEGSAFSQYTAFGQSGAFACYQEGFLNLIRLDCPENSPAPNFDPALYNGKIICDPRNTSLLPPLGFDHLYSESGERFDSLSFQVIGQSRPQSFRAADEEGCLSQASLPINVKVSYTPERPIISVVDENLSKERRDTFPICEDGAAFLVASRNRSNHRILWSNGAQGLSLIADTAGAFSAVEVNELGCKSPASNAITLYARDQKASVPPKALNPEGDEVLLDCDGNRSIQVQAEKGYQGYLWKLQEGQPFIFETLPTLPLSRQNGSLQSFSLMAVDENACFTKARQTSFRFINTRRPTVPRVSLLDNVLAIQGSGQIHEWYRDNELIPGSNTPVLSAEVSGNYQVRINNGICWSRKSAAVFIP